MVDLFKKINKKIDSIIWSMVSTGIILLVLAVLIVWTDFMLRLVFGLMVMVVAWAFLYGSYRLWHIKKEIREHFKL
jgi:1,4-dihydroxy-2-naphthoate octaprenyltransferase